MGLSYLETPVHSDAGRDGNIAMAMPRWQRRAGAPLTGPNNRTASIHRGGGERKIYPQRRKIARASCATAEKAAMGAP